MKRETVQEPSEGAIQAWARLIRAGGSVLAGVEADLKAEGFPPLSWYDVLLELRRTPEGRLRPLEIEQHLLIAQHNVSRLIDRLQKAGLVERSRCKADGRGQWVVLTEGGRALLRQMWPAYAAAIQRRFAEKLCGEEQAALASLLAKLIDRAPACGGPPRSE